MTTNSTATRRAFVRRLAATTGLLLAATAGSASAQQIEASLGRFNTVEVAILGSEAFSPNAVSRKGLVLGWRQQGHDGGYVPALWLSRAHHDLNGDGYRDAIALFRPNDSDFQDLRDGASVLVEVRGIYQDDIFGHAFVAQTTLVEDDDPSSACTTVQNSLAVAVGVRCIWTTADGSAYKPILTQQLIDDLNQELSSTNLEIAPTSSVVIEAYGGKGNGGANHDGAGCTAKGGSAGAAGYAQTIVTFAEVPSDLYIYPGGSASSNGGGGASTVVSSVDLASLSADDLNSTTAADLASFGILAIGGGGGGGGEGEVSGAAFQDCHHGGDGGPGGSAIADTSGDAVGAGGDGTEHGTPGDGGNGTGGDGTPSGSGGIGGPGGAGYNDGVSGVGGGPLWNGWSTADNAEYSPTGWIFGAGGAGNSSSGAGGGGFGGGGTADGENQGHKGGGGGGGAMAVQATVDSDTTDTSLIYGTPDQSGAVGQVVVTFELMTTQ